MNEQRYRQAERTYWRHHGMEPGERWRILVGLGALMVLDDAWLFLAIGGRTRNARNAVAGVGATVLVVAGYLVAAGNFGVAVVCAFFAVFAAEGLVLARGTASP